MRIAQFTDSFIPVVDGVGNVVFQYAKNFGEKEHESYVIAPQTDTGYRGKYPFEIIDYVGVTLPYISQYQVGAPILDNHYHKRLQMIEADMVHVHSPFIAGQAGLSFAKDRNLPVVGTFHSKYYDDFLQMTGFELLAEVGTSYVVSFYSKCTEVWAVSGSSAETLRSYGYKGHIEVMPNGTDIRKIPEGEKEKVSREFALGEDPVLLFVGQLNWKKNIECILKAAAKVNRPFKLVMAGRGPHEKEIRKEADALGLSDKMVYTGHLTDRDALGGLYQRASLFVFPSLYDTSGLVVREAAAMETPSVVVAGSSAAECILDRENGLLCQNDPDDLARVMEEALADPDSLARLGKKAKETIPIPWTNLTDQVLARYKVIKEYTER